MPHEQTHLPPPEAVARRGKLTAANVEHPCPQCPWLTANFEKDPDPGGWYTDSNLRRLWAGLRDGERMTCHPTDPAMNDCDGITRPVPESVTTKECTGALVLIQRELDRMQKIMLAGGTFADYKRKHRHGVTKDGAAAHLFAMAVVMPGEVPVARPNLANTDVGFHLLDPWVPAS